MSSVWVFYVWPEPKTIVQLNVRFFYHAFLYSAAFGPPMWYYSSSASFYAFGLIFAPVDAAFHALNVTPWPPNLQFPLVRVLYRSKVTPLISRFLQAIFLAFDRWTHTTHSFFIFVCFHTHVLCVGVHLCVLLLFVSCFVRVFLCLFGFSRVLFFLFLYLFFYSLSFHVEGFRRSRNERVCFFFLFVLCVYLTSGVRGFWFLCRLLYPVFFSLPFFLEAFIGCV